MGFAPNVAATKEDRQRVLALRRSLPEKAPAGWAAMFTDIRRVNDYTEPGVFSQMYRGCALRIAFTLSGDGPVRITFVHESDADLTKAHIQRVLAAFWPDGGAEVRKETAKLAVVTPV